MPSTCGGDFVSKWAMDYFLKLRLEYVITGKFDAPSADIPEPLASLTTV